MSKNGLLGGVFLACWGGKCFAKKRNFVANDLTENTKIMAKQEKPKSTQVRLYVPDLYMQVIECVKEFTGIESDSQAVNAILADFIAKGMNVQGMRREYDRVEKEIVAKYKNGLIQSVIQSNPNNLSSLSIPEVQDMLTHPEPTEGMDHIYLKPIPADWFKAVKCGATGIYKLERRFTRDERFLKPPPHGEHNPYFPNPDKIMIESGGGEVWRIKRSGTWTYFIKLSTGYYFCDWNGYRMGDYTNLGVDIETERDDFPHLFANLSRQAREQLEDDIMDAKDLSDYSDILQPVVTPDYRYYDTSETLTFLT